MLVSKYVNIIHCNFTRNCFLFSSRDDLARAIKKLRVLGGGFTVIPVGGRRLVQSVPGELNMDHTAVLQRAEVGQIKSIINFIFSSSSVDCSY